MNAILTRHRGIPAQDGAGVKLTRIVNQPSLPHQDPFLMLDEFRSDDPNDYIAGFPPHPHRGFVTLTYMLAGRMEHQDSVGNTGVVEAGGVQWMKAARGIIHAEMPKQEEGLMWGFQLWLNLPAKDKLSAAQWADHRAETIPQWHGDAVTVRVIAGTETFDGEVVTGPVQQPEQHFQMLDVQFAAAGQWQQRGPTPQTRLGYVYQGEVWLNDQLLQRGELVRLAADADLTLRSEAQAGMLLLAAQPIGEPIVQYGPFVMNSHAEIEQAIRDYQAGRFTAT